MVGVPTEFFSRDFLVIIELGSKNIPQMADRRNFFLAQNRFSWQFQNVENFNKKNKTPSINTAIKKKIKININNIKSY
jgi:hypothetical protein